MHKLNDLNDDDKYGITKLKDYKFQYVVFSQ